MLTFSGHLDVLRKMLLRILAVVIISSIVIFCFRKPVFDFLLAPSRWNFCTYRGIEMLCSGVGYDYNFEPYTIRLISTELSGQFMAHISTSLWLGILCASPYILYEIFRFIVPALYENERRYSIKVAVAAYLLFTLGVAMSYFVIFPISFHFLGTYQVDFSVENQITLSSYISTFATLTFLMGLVFQVPIITFFLARLGFLSASTMAHYRKHAIIIIAVIAAIITPPDIFSLVMVAVPIYLLYEISIRLIHHTCKEI